MLALLEVELAAVAVDGLGVWVAFEPDQVRIRSGKASQVIGSLRW